MTGFDRVVERVATARPDALAVSDGARSMTYGELVATADAVASRLAAIGAKGGRVAVLLPRSARTVAVLLGVIRAGAAYVPIDLRQPSSRRDLLVARSEPVVVIGEEAVAGEPPHLAGDELCAASTVAPPERRHGASDPMYLIHTSGSTGVPKGVVVSHGNVDHLARWHVRAFALGPGSVVAQFAPLGFDASVWEIWPCLAAGATLEIVPEAVRPFPASFCAWSEEHHVTQCFLPTPVAEAALPLLVERPGALEWLLTGGDRLRSFRPPGLRPRFVNAYGPTEATVLATVGDVPVEADAVTAEPTLGRPIDGVGVHVLDDELRECPPGNVGELCISGAGVALGYHGRPEEERRRFVGWQGVRLYRTGDRGRLLPTGEIAYEGRQDQQVKVHGHRVELGEVEAAVLRCPGVVSAVAIHVPATQEIVAFVTGDVDAQEVRAAAAAVLARQTVPRIRVVPRLPHTASGKIDRRLLETQSGAACGGPGGRSTCA